MWYNVPTGGDTMAREITAAQRKAVGNYEKNNYDKVLVRMYKGERDKIKEAADKVGQSVNAYIMESVRDRMNKEQ
jgi:predicted HicB family RNase H-like nuclease